MFYEVSFTALKKVKSWIISSGFKIAFTKIAEINDHWTISFWFINEHWKQANRISIILVKIFYVSLKGVYT